MNLKHFWEFKTLPHTKRHIIVYQEYSIITRLGVKNLLILINAIYIYIEREREREIVKCKKIALIKSF